MTDIKVFNPQGESGTIDSTNLQDALAQGYKVNDGSTPAPTPQVDQNPQIRVVSADGQTGTIAESDLPDARLQGFKTEDEHKSEQYQKKFAPQGDWWHTWARNVGSGNAEDEGWLAKGSHAVFNAGYNAIDTVLDHTEHETREAAFQHQSWQAVPEKYREFLYNQKVPEADLPAAVDAMQKLDAQNPDAEGRGKFAQGIIEGAPLLPIAAAGGELAVGALGIPAAGTVAGATLGPTLARLGIEAGAFTTVFNGPDAVKNIIVDKNPALAAENLFSGLVENAGFIALGGMLGKAAKATPSVLSGAKDFFQGKSAEPGQSAAGWSGLGGVANALTPGTSIERQGAEVLRKLAYSKAEIGKLIDNGKLKDEIADIDRLYPGLTEATTEKQGQIIKKIKQQAGQDIGDIVDNQATNLSHIDSPKPVVPEAGRLQNPPEQPTSDHFYDTELRMAYAQSDSTLPFDEWKNTQEGVQASIDAGEKYNKIKLGKISKEDFVKGQLEQTGLNQIAEGTSGLDDALNELTSKIEANRAQLEGISPHDEYTKSVIRPTYDEYLKKVAPDRYYDEYLKMRTESSSKITYDEFLKTKEVDASSKPLTYDEYMKSVNPPETEPEFDEKAAATPEDLELEEGEQREPNESPWGDAKQKTEEEEATPADYEANDFRDKAGDEINELNSKKKLSKKDKARKAELEKFIEEDNAAHESRIRRIYKNQGQDYDKEFNELFPEEEEDTSGNDKIEKEELFNSLIKREDKYHEYQELENKQQAREDRLAQLKNSKKPNKASIEKLQSEIDADKSASEVRKEFIKQWEQDDNWTASDNEERTGEKANAYNPEEEEDIFPQYLTPQADLEEEENRINNEKELEKLNSKDKLSKIDKARKAELENLIKNDDDFVEDRRNRIKNNWEEPNNEKIKEKVEEPKETEEKPSITKEPELSPEQKALAEEKTNKQKALVEENKRLEEEYNRLKKMQDVNQQAAKVLKTKSIADYDRIQQYAPPEVQDGVSVPTQAPANDNITTNFSNRFNANKVIDQITKFAKDDDAKLDQKKIQFVKQARTKLEKANVDGVISPKEAKDILTSLRKSITKGPGDDVSYFQREVVNMIKTEHDLANERIFNAANRSELSAKLKAANRTYELGVKMKSGRTLIGNEPNVGGGGSHRPTSAHGVAAAAIATPARKGIFKFWAEKGSYKFAKGRYTAALRAGNDPLADGVINSTAKWNKTLSTASTIFKRVAVNSAISYNADRIAAQTYIKKYDGLKVLLGPTANGLSKDQQYYRALDILTNPNISSQQQEIAAQTGPKLAQGVLRQLQTAHVILQQFIKPLQQDQPFQKNTKLSPTEQQLSKLNDAVRLVNNPAELLRDYEARTLTPEKVMLVKTLFPASYAIMMQDANLDHQNIHLDLEGRLWYSMLIGHGI